MQKREKSADSKTVLSKSTPTHSFPVKLFFAIPFSHDLSSPLSAAEQNKQSKRELYKQMPIRLGQYYSDSSRRKIRTTTTMTATKKTTAAVVKRSEKLLTRKEREKKVYGHLHLKRGHTYTSIVRRGRSLSFPTTRMGREQENLPEE